MKSKSNYAVILLGVLFLLLLLSSCKPGDKPTPGNKKTIPAEEYKLETVWVKTLKLSPYITSGKTTLFVMEPLIDDDLTYLTYVFGYDLPHSKQPDGYVVIAISNTSGRVLWTKQSTSDVLAGFEEPIAPRLTSRNELELALFHKGEDARSLHYLYLHGKNGSELFERPAKKRVDRELQKGSNKFAREGLIMILPDEKPVIQGKYDKSGRYDKSTYYKHNSLEDKGELWSFKLGMDEWDFYPPETDGKIILLKYFRKMNRAGATEMKYAILDEKTGKLLIRPFRIFSAAEWPILLSGKRLLYSYHDQNDSLNISTRLMLKKIVPVHEIDQTGRLYLRSWQADNIFAIDAADGIILKKFPVKATQSGLEVSPDGNTIYVADFDDNDVGRLRIINAENFKIIRAEALPDFVALLGGEPISLSGDGRWLLISHYYQNKNTKLIDENTPTPTSIYDTSARKFLVSASRASGEGEMGNGSEYAGLADTVNIIEHCKGEPTAPKLAGRPGYDLLFMICRDSLVALRSKDLKIEWTKPIGGTRGQALTFDSYSRRLYLMQPLVEKTEADTMKVLSTDIRITVFDATTGKQLNTALLNDQTSVPRATVGRGDQGYMEISPDGTQLYVVWEDRLWVMDSVTISIVKEIALPAPGEETALSPDGDRLYIVPASSGDLTKRGDEVWIYDTQHTQLLTVIPFEMPNGILPNKIISVSSPAIN